jgi:hypothetical protein
MMWVLLQKSWLQQIHVMQGECLRDMTVSSSLRPTSFRFVVFMIVSASPTLFIP